MHLFNRIFPGSSRQEAADTGSLVQQFIVDKSLAVVFQPVVSVRDAAILGHEALVRGPKGNSLESASALSAAAQREKCQRAYELICAETAMQRWVRAHGQGKLLINVSAACLGGVNGANMAETLVQALRSCRVPPGSVVFEISGYSKFEQIAALLQAVQFIHSVGEQVALDGLKGSRSNIDAWDTLSPDVVKLDARLTHDIARDADKARVLASLVSLAAKRRTLLVAKGVESAADLRALAALGVGYAQGFFLGSPDAVPIEAVNYRAHTVITAGPGSTHCDIDFATL